MNNSIFEEDQDRNSQLSYNNNYTNGLEVESLSADTKNKRKLMNQLRVAEDYFKQWQRFKQLS